MTGRAIKLPEIANRDYRVTDFGAKADDAADNRPAILAAIKKASDAGGGQRVDGRLDWRLMQLSLVRSSLH